MSRIGGKSIIVPEDVNVSLHDTNLKVSGKNGELNVKVNSLVEVLLSDKMINVKPLKNDKFSKSMWGTVRSNINNTIIGVSKGYSKKLEINGVGYRASTSGEKLQLNLGFSHPVEIKIPNGLKVSVENNTQITITGADKQLLGQFASEIRQKRPPEPFKGKGIKYSDEIIIRKEGKKK